MDKSVANRNDVGQFNGMRSELRMNVERSMAIYLKLINRTMKCNFRRDKCCVWWQWQLVWIVECEKVFLFTPFGKELLGIIGTCTQKKTQGIPCGKLVWMWSFASIFKICSKIIIRVHAHNFKSSRLPTTIFPRCLRWLNPISGHSQNPWQNSRHLENLVTNFAAQLFAPIRFYLFQPPLLQQQLFL